MHHEIRTTLDCFNILIRWSMSADFSLATVKSRPLTAENPKKKNPETKPVVLNTKSRSHLVHTVGRLTGFKDV